MIIYATLFLGLFSVLNPFISAFFASGNAIGSLCSILIFASIAVAVFLHQRWAWAAMFLSIVAMVAVDVLAPYQSMIVICFSAIIAMMGTVIIKRPINRWIRRDALSASPLIPQWLRGILRVL